MSNKKPPIKGGFFRKSGREPCKKIYMTCLYIKIIYLRCQEKSIALFDFNVYNEKCIKESKLYKVSWSFNKGIYAVGGAVVSFTQDIHQAMIGLLLCIGIDTITGFIAAPYRGQMRESSRLSRVVTKIITYFTSTIAIHIAEMMVLPTYIAGTLELARMAMTIFCALEVYSTCENLRDITGLKVFDIITMNFKKKVEQSVGIEIPKGKRNAKKSN